LHSCCKFDKNGLREVDQESQTIINSNHWLCSRRKSITSIKLTESAHTIDADCLSITFALFCSQSCVLVSRAQKSISWRFNFNAEQNWPSSKIIRMQVTSLSPVQN